MILAKSKFLISQLTLSQVFYLPRHWMPLRKMVSHELGDDKKKTMDYTNKTNILTVGEVQLLVNPRWTEKKHQFMMSMN